MPNPRAEARNIRDLFQAHMSGSKKTETDADSPTNPHIDQNLPDRQPDPQPREGKAKRKHAGRRKLRDSQLDDSPNRGR